MKQCVQGTCKAFLDLLNKIKMFTSNTETGYFEASINMYV